MNCKVKYLAGLLVCSFYIGCSSGEFDIKEVTVDYTEKQLVYDTIKTVAKTDDTSSKINNQNKEFTNKNESFSFIVQIGAFIDKSNFDRFFETSRSRLGNEVYYELVNYLYKIRIGSYNNKAEALKMLNYVKSLGYDDAFVITVKNK